MSRLIPRIVCAALLVTMALPSLSRAQPPAAPAPPTPTIWRFLGIPQGLRKIRGATINRRGNHPRLEKRPPLKSLAAPENLLSGDPAIKRAAEVKQAEDMAKQKIKAIKYLAEIGCGCYDKDGSITAALIEKMAADQECTERVRVAAVEAVTEAASGVCCSECGQTCCCNEQMVKHLAKVAYERDDTGCCYEPSKRIRDLAAEALKICCPDTGPVIEEMGDAEEVDGPERPEVIDDEEVDRESMDDEGDGEIDAEEENDDEVTGDQLLLPHLQPSITSRMKEKRHLAPVIDGNMFRARPQGVAGNVPQLQAKPHPKLRRINTPATIQQGGAKSQGGVIVHLDRQRRLAHVHLQDETAQLPIGSQVTVVQQQGGRNVVVGALRVVGSFKGSVNVAAPNQVDLEKIRRGDAVAVPPAPRVARPPSTNVPVVRSAVRTYRSRYPMPR